MTRRLALLGLSGVGKSTLIGQVGRCVPLLHLQASGLIKAEQAQRLQTQDTSEALRTGPVLDNQALLIAGFRRLTERAALPVVFDGHSVIDGRDGLVEIPSAVFAALGLDAVCFLFADPATICERRSRDTGRNRPIRDTRTLGAHQTFAATVAERIARDIDRPFYILKADARARLLQLVRSSTDVLGTATIGPSC